MKALRIGADGFKLEASVADDVIAIVGRRGRGKTTTAVVLVEELHDAGARFCVLDPVGVWWGLKSSKDGKAAGIPVVVMGGEHADVPLEDTAGKVIADFVADPASPSVVLDFRGFRKGQITRFATDFLEQLYHRNRAPLHLVLDEADQFAPQRVMGEVARLVGAAEDVCKMGRARGLHPIVITQRPAALNKNVLTQAGLLVAHALTGPQDQKAVDEWIRANADELQRARFLETIPGLVMGVAWFWQPTIPIFRQVRVRDRRTFDSSATPKEGQVRAPKVLAEVDLEELKKRIASTIEKQKAEDPKELRRQLAEARAQLAKAQRKNVSDSLTSKPPRVVDRPVLKDAQIKRVEDSLARMDKQCVRIGEETQRLIDLHADVRARQADLKAALAAARDTRERGPGRDVLGRPVPGPAPMRPTPVVPRAPRPSSSGGPLPSAQQRIVDAIAWLTGVGIARPDKTQVSLFAKLVPGAGHTVSMFGALRTAGLIDYPTPGTVTLTPAGTAQADSSTVPQSAEEMQAQVMGTLPKAQRAILRDVGLRHRRRVRRDEDLCSPVWPAPGTRPACVDVRPAPRAGPDRLPRPLAKSRPCRFSSSRVRDPADPAHARGAEDAGLRATPAPRPRPGVRGLAGVRRRPDRLRRGYCAAHCG